MAVKKIVTIETGQQVGDWVVLEIIQRQGTDLRYLCQCFCGMEKMLSASALGKGKPQNCGCRKDTGNKSNAEKNELPSNESLEDFELINRGFLPFADQLSSDNGAPTWSLASFARVLGMSRRELINHIRSAGSRFNDPHGPG
jgi:hypothetical protein